MNDKIKIRPDSADASVGCTALPSSGLRVMMKQASRNEYIDTLRGLACILLVLWHAVGGNPRSGFHIGEGSLWRIFVDFFSYIRMPLFAFLSGYVYSWRPFAGNHGGFLAGKARRLLLPMLVVGTLFAIAQSNIPGTNNGGRDWTTLHVVPIAHFWFLESLFIIFMIVMILESLKLLNSPLRLAIVFAIAVVIQLTSPAPKFLGLGGVIYLLPYFLFGVACSRYSLHEIGHRHLNLSVALTILLGASAYALAGLLGYVPISPRISIVALLIGTTALFILVCCGWNNTILNYVGRSSYAIFLFHVFFTAGTRIVAYRWQFTDVNTLILLATANGILGPMLVEHFANRLSFTRTVLLGRRWTEMDRESRRANAESW